MNQLDKQQYAAKFREAHSRLWTIAVAVTGNRHLAEDVVQDAAITGLKKLADFDPETSFIAWMSQIVRFTALNCLKTTKKRKAASLDIHEYIDAEGSSHIAAGTSVTLGGEISADQEAFDDQFIAAMDTLDPERRACLLMRVVHNLAYDEIAAAVGIPEGTAMSHVHRAKASLRSILAQSKGRSRA